MSKCHSAFHGFLSPFAYRAFIIGTFVFLCIMNLTFIVLGVVSNAIILILVFGSLLIFTIICSFVDYFSVYLKYYIKQDKVIIMFGKKCIREICLNNVKILEKELVTTIYKRRSSGKTVISRDRYILISTPDVDLYSFFFDTELEIKDIMKKNVIPIPYEARFALFNTYKENFGCDNNDKTFAALEKIVKRDS